MRVDGITAAVASMAAMAAAQPDRPPSPTRSMPQTRIRRAAPPTAPDIKHQPRWLAADIGAAEDGLRPQALRNASLRSQTSAAARPNQMKCDSASTSTSS